MVSKVVTTLIFNFWPNWSFSLTVWTSFSRSSAAFNWASWTCPAFQRRWLHNPPKRRQGRLYLVDKHSKINILYIPGTCLSSILVVEPFKTRSFPIKTRVIWVPGLYSANGGDFSNYLLLMVKRNPILLTSWYEESTIVYQVLYIPGGCLGFLNHQQCSTCQVPPSQQERNWPSNHLCSLPAKMLVTSIVPQ